MGWASTSRWPGSRLLDSLANTLLDLGLPRIRAWLQQRFGPQADVERVRLDGGVVTLERARLPLGGVAVLLIDEARARVGTSGSKLRLLDLRGTIRVEGSRRFEAPVEFGDEPGLDEQWVHGRLRVHDATWTASHGQDEQAPLSGELFAQLSSQSWSVRDGAFRCAAAEIELGARGTMQDGAEMPIEDARLSFTGARAGHLFDALLALAGQDLELTRSLPWAAMLEGELEFDARAGLHTTLSAALSADEQVQLSGRLSLDGTLSEVQLAGSLDPRTVPLLEPKLSELLVANTPLVCALEGAVEGTLDLPRWRATLDAPTLGIQALPDHTLQAIHVEAEGGRDQFTARLSAAGPAGLTVQAFAGWTPTDSDTTRPGSLEARLARGDSALAIRGSFNADYELDARAEGAVELDDLAHLIPALGDQLVGPARAELELELDYDAPSEALQIDARATLNRFRIVGRSHDMSEVELELTGTLDGTGFEGQLALKTPSSALELEPLCIDREGQLEGSALHGRLSSQDLQSFVLIEDPVTLLPDAHVHGRLTLTGTLAAPILDGDLRADAIPLRIPAGKDGRVKVVVTEALGHARVEPERFIYERITFRWASSRFAISGELPYSGERGTKPAAVLEILEGHPALAATAASIAAGARIASVEGRGQASYLVPMSLRLFGVIEAHIDGAVEAKLGLETSGSALIAEIAVHEQRLRGKLTGHAALAELDIVGVLALLPLGLDTQGRAKLDVELGGSVDAPHAEAKLGAKSIALRLGPDRLTVDGLELSARVDAKRATVERLTLRRGEGTLTGNGEWRFDRPSARAELRWRELMIDDLPLDQLGAKRVRSYVQGRSEGQLELHWIGQGLAGLSAEGRLGLDDAAYPFLYAYRSSLRRLGLPEPRVAGTTPAKLRAVFDGKRLELTNIEGAVRGCAIEGHVGISTAGPLDGQLHATVPASYLEHSPLLKLPAKLTGDLQVPVAVGGTIDAPRFDPDVLSTVGAMFGRNERSASSRVDEWLSKPKAPDMPKRRKPATSDEAKVDDAVEARVVEGSREEGDKLLRQLMDAGVDIEVIERMLERRRKRRKS